MDCKMTGHGCMAAAALCSALMAVSCADRFNMDLPLAVSAHKLEFTSSSGSTHILVYSDGGWTAGFDRTIEWGSLNKLSGEGNSDIVFTYSANYGLSRSVGLVLSKGSLKDTVQLCQAGTVTAPSLSFGSGKLSLPLKNEAGISTPISTNMRYSIDEFSCRTMYLGAEGDTLGVVTAGEQAPAGLDTWIGDISFTSSKVSYKVSENSTGAVRTAVLILSVTSAEDVEYTASQTVTQGIDSPEFALSQVEMSLQGYSGEYVIPTSANNVYNYTENLSYSVEYDGSADEDSGWVSSAVVSEDGLDFTVEQNGTGAERTATITVTYSDASGTEITQTLKLTQQPYIGYAQIRALPDGVITDPLFIDGYIISDRSSENVSRNTQTAQFKFDFTTSRRTAYLESPDGQYGFRLVFDTVEDNVAERWSKVNLSLQGAVLTKETDPDRYTISGLTAANLTDIYEPDEASVPQKSRSIAELTDDDIYTLVTLQNVEVLCKDGSYTNATDGYSIKDNDAGINPSGTSSSPRWDTVPLTMTDYDGSSIYMLTNSYVPWRRDGTGGNNDSVVPQGSGTFRGVVVSEENPRYGNYGRYQVRAMDEDDLDMDDTPFSNTIVEWTWNDKQADLIPETGSGSLDFDGGTVSGTADFNNTVWQDASGTNYKGLINSAALKIARKWWDFTADEGGHFDISFSTSGLSGYNMIFGIVWGHGDMNNTTLDAPAHWNLLYSIDGGTTFNAVPGSDVIRNRSIVWWTTTSQDSCPGYEEYVRKLPDECFGKEQVVLRMQVADKVTDIKPGTAAGTYLTNLGVEKGTLTDKSTTIRIGTITVRYN